MTGADDGARSGAGRAAPSWLHETCPAWCTRDHHEDDHPEDRYHQSDPATFPAIAGAGDTVPLTASLRPLVLAVRTGRHVGDTATWLAIEALDERRPRIVLASGSATAVLQHLGAQLRAVAD